MLVKGITIFNVPTSIYVIRNKDSYIMQCIDPGNVVKFTDEISMMEVVEISIHKNMITINVEEVNYVYPGNTR